MLGKRDAVVLVIALGMLSASLVAATSSTAAREAPKRDDLRLYGLSVGPISGGEQSGAFNAICYVCPEDDSDNRDSKSAGIGCALYAQGGIIDAEAVCSQGREASAQSLTLSEPGVAQSEPGTADASSSAAAAVTTAGQGADASDHDGSESESESLSDSSREADSSLPSRLHPRNAPVSDTLFFVDSVPSSDSASDTSHAGSFKWAANAVAPHQQTEGETT